MIRKYTEEDFFLLQSWITDATTLFQVAGSSWTYPLTPTQINRHRLDHPHKQLYIGYDQRNEPVAIGEIITNDEHSPRLGRILVGDQAKRGKGLGERFVRELVDECVRLYNPRNICLFVLESNVSAANCYKKIGFQFTDEAIPDMVFHDRSFRVLKMVMNLKERETVA